MIHKENRRLISCIIFISFVFLGSCKTKLEFEKIRQAPRIDEKNFPDVENVIVLDKSVVSFQFDEQRQAVIAIHEKTLQQRILRKNQNIPKPFLFLTISTPQFTITDIGGRIVKTDGREIPLNEEITYENIQAELQSQHKLIQVRYENTEIGDFIELKWKETISDLTALHPFVFGNQYPIIRSEFTVNIPPGFEIDYYISRKGNKILWDPEIFILPKEQGRRLFWLKKNIPPIFSESQGDTIEFLSDTAYLAFVRYKHHISVAGYETWDQLARKAMDYLYIKDQVTSAVKKTLSDITTYDKDSQDSLQSIYEYVAYSITSIKPENISVSDKPASFEKILQEKKATPRDKNLLLLSFLREQGLNAYPILVSLKKTFPVTPDFPTLAVFDHIIVEVENEHGKYYLDSSCQSCPFGTLPPQVKENFGLYLHSSFAKLFKIPSERDDENNIMKTHYNLEITNKGLLFGIINSEFQGLAAIDMRNLLQKRTDEGWIKDVIQNMLFQKPSQLAIHEIMLKPEMIQSPNVPLKFQVSVQKEESFSLSLADIFGFIEPSSRDEYRRYNLDLKYPMTHYASIEMRLAEDLTFQKIPEEESISWDGGNMAVEFEKKKRNYIKIRFKMVRTQFYIPKQIYPKYSTFHRDILKILQKPIIIGKL